MDLRTYVYARYVVHTAGKVTIIPFMSYSLDCLSNEFVTFRGNCDHLCMMCYTPLPTHPPTTHAQEHMPHTHTPHQRQWLQSVGSHQCGDPVVDWHACPQEEDANRTDEGVHITGTREAVPGGGGATQWSTRLLIGYRIAEKCRGRKFRNFPENQTFCGFNFAILFGYFVFVLRNFAF